MRVVCEESAVQPQRIDVHLVRATREEICVSIFTREENMRINVSMFYMFLMFNVKVEV